MKKGFISYAHQDAEFARHLLASLGDADISEWMDSADIAPGEAFAHKIKESIKSAGVVVILVSPRSIDDQWIQFEVGAAWGLGKRVVLILVGGADSEFTLPVWISGFAFLDARDRPIKDVAMDVAQAISAE